MGGFELQIPFRWLTGLVGVVVVVVVVVGGGGGVVGGGLVGVVGCLRYLGQGAAAAVAFLEGGGLHASRKSERMGEKKRKEKVPMSTSRDLRRDDTSSSVGISRVVANTAGNWRKSVLSVALGLVVWGCRCR